MSRSDELEIGFWGRVVRRGWRLIGVVVVLCCALTVAALLQRGPGFRATTEVFVPGTDLAPEARFARSRHVLDQVRVTLGYEPQVVVVAGEGDAIVEIEATARTAEEAVRVADIYAATYVRLRDDASDQATRAAVGDLERAVAATELELATLPRGDPEGRTPVLQRELAAYQDALATAVSGGVADPRARPVVLQQATAVPVRDRPAILLYGLAAAVIGLIAGLGVAAIRTGLDPRIGGPADATAALRAPLLGTTPAAKQLMSAPRRGWRRRGRLGNGRLLARPGTPKGEAIDLVRARLLTKDRRKLRGTVQVCAVAEVDRVDAAAVAVNLAQSVARSGVSCALVWADFRYSSDILAILGVDPRGRGLAEVVEGDALADVLRRPDAVPNLSVLVPGESPVSVADLLSGRAFARLLTEVIDVAEVAVVYTPPLRGHADGQLVGGAVDAAVVVASARTHRVDLERAEEDMRAAGANVVGIVFSGVASSGAAGA